MQNFSRSAHKDETVLCGFLAESECVSPTKAMSSGIRLKTRARIHPALAVMPGVGESDAATGVP